MLAQYWICERTTLVQPSYPDAFPRYRKWDLSRLKFALNKSITNLGSHQVKCHPITPRLLETKSLSIPGCSKDSPHFEFGSTSKHDQSYPHDKAIKPSSATAPRLQNRHFTTPPTHYPDDEDNIPISKLYYTHSEDTTTISPVVATAPSAQHTPTPTAAPPQPNSSTTPSVGKKSSIDGPESEVMSLKTKLAEALTQCSQWKTMYEAEVEKTTKLQSDLKAQLEENALLDEKVILLTVEKTELQCGISPPQQIPKPTPAQPLDPIKNSPATDKQIGHMIDIPAPSFSLGLTQDAPPAIDQPEGSTALVPIYLAPQPDDPAVATRTRSHKEALTPVPRSSDSKLVKNYRMTNAYKQLSPGHKFMVNDLASHPELEG